MSFVHQSVGTAEHIVGGHSELAHLHLPDMRSVKKSSRNYLIHQYSDERED